jgi:hypothetical protein
MDTSHVTAAATYGAWAPIENYHEVKAALAEHTRWSAVDARRYPALVFDVLNKAHRYRNRLTDMERKRRAICDAVINANGNVSEVKVQIDALDAELTEIRERIQKAKAGKTKAERQKPDPVDVARAATIKAELKSLRARYKDLRTYTRSGACRDVITSIEEAYAAAIKVARSERDCYWGTGNAVEDAAKQSFKTSKGLPKFVAFNGGGTLAVQLQGGKTWDELTAGNGTQVRIDPLPAEAWADNRAERRAKNKTFIHLRGASENNKPVWVTFPVCIHRLPPQGARIKTVKAIRRKVGHRFKWKINISYDAQREAILHAVAEDRAQWIAIDVGWRQFPKVATADDPNTYPGPGTIKNRPEEEKLTREEGQLYSRACRLADTDHIDQAYNILRMLPQARTRLQQRLAGPHTIRIAYWRDSEGASGEIALDAGYARANQLRERLDANVKTCFNTFHKALGEWLDTNPNVLPQDFLVAVKPAFRYRADETDCATVFDQETFTKRLKKVKSAARLQTLYDIWRWWGDSIPNSSTIWDQFVAWHRQDHHLVDWIANLRDKTQGRRREKYRVMAADIARRYQTIYIEDFSLPEVIEKPLPEDVDAEHRNKLAEQNRRLAGISVWRDALQNASRTRAAEYVALDPACTTRQCALCGHCVQWDQAKEIVHTCPGCGASWDQDDNAAINLGRLGSTGSMDPIGTE